MTEPNCFTCPSKLTPIEAQRFFGKNIGVPMCARFGKPLATIKTKAAQLNDVGKAIAKNCSEYGKERPTSVNWDSAQFAVTMPDIEVMRFNRKRDQANVRTCGSCEHFVREDIVATELGFGTGMCAAFGKLLLPSRMSYEARDCDERSFAVDGVRTDVTGLMMLPEYDRDFSLSADPVKYHKQMTQTFIDPVNYPTDFEVTPEDEADGIRAWRKIEDPATGNFTKLPIFRIDFFLPEEQAKIPRTGDEEHPEDYVDHNFYTYKAAVLWRELDETPAAWGMAGTGKTELGRYLAWLMCAPFERVSITGSSEIDDLAGKWTYDPALGTVWHDGRVVEAWSKPCVFVLDEPNTGPPDVAQFVRPMFDNSKQLVLDQHKGERRTRNDHCYPLLCMNPAWDPRNVGAHQLSDADANRLMHLYFTLPPVKLEKEILITRCKHDGYELPGDRLDTIMKIADDIRNLTEEGTIPITWGIRPQLKVARASKWFDLISCYRMAVADFLDPQAQQEILDVVKSHVE